MNLAMDILPLPLPLGGILNSKEAFYTIHPSTEIRPTAASMSFSRQFSLFLWHDVNLNNTQKYGAKDQQTKQCDEFNTYFSSTGSNTCLKLSFCIFEGVQT
jgi:hypothetical protein